MKKYTVEYRVGEYRGTVVVFADENDDNDCIIAKAKKRLKVECGGSYTTGMCSESWSVKGAE